MVRSGGGQRECERRIEVIVKVQNKNSEGGGLGLVRGVVGWGGGLVGSKVMLSMGDVNQE